MAQQYVGRGARRRTGGDSLWTADPRRRSDRRRASPSSTYETNTDADSTRYEDLAYKRAQIEAREKALKQSAGGGLLGGGTPTDALLVGLTVSSSRARAPSASPRRWRSPRLRQRPTAAQSAGNVPAETPGPQPTANATDTYAPRRGRRSSSARSTSRRSYARHPPVERGTNGDDLRRRPLQDGGKIPSVRSLCARTTPPLSRFPSLRGRLRRRRHSTANTPRFAVVLGPPAAAAKSSAHSHRCGVARRGNCRVYLDDRRRLQRNSRREGRPEVRGPHHFSVHPDRLTTCLLSMSIITIVVGAAAFPFYDRIHDAINAALRGAVGGSCWRSPLSCRCEDRPLAPST